MEFPWHRRTPTVEACIIGEIHMEANIDGRWLVNLSGERMCDHTHQTIGSDIDDAKARAQAYTMILIDLIENKKPNG